MKISDDQLQQLVQARVKANALYSLYKEARDQEETYYSIIAEQLGEPDFTASGVIHDVRKVIDGAKQ